MHIYYDVVVIGTGIAGLFTALNISQNQNVLLISKSQLDSGNSALAQGGIVSCKNKQVHFKDTITAGCFYNNEDAVRLIENFSSENIDKLIDYGVNFDRDNLGQLKFTREGGHSEETILYSKDTTGREIISCLTCHVKGRKNINRLENTLVTELIVKDTKIYAIEVLDSLEQIKIYYADKVVIATGGIGMIYKNTTNSLESVGDGIALASKVGVKIRDMEFIQFHPTAMYGDDYEKRFLISEAVRGEGGILKNIDGEAFMKNYHPLGDLAPRDIVARGIFREMQKTDSEFVFLDITHKDSNYIINRFPNIYKKCLETGVDITKDFIRVAPAEHYVMGGIETDLDGKTSVEGLFACGECACTGVHGANRLASNSLLEGIVFGGQIAKKINQDYMPTEKIKINLNLKTDNKVYNKSVMSDISIKEIEHNLRDIMTKYVSIIRTEKDMLYALDEIKKLERLLPKNHLNKKLFELKSMILVSKLIITSALSREESLGTHFIIKSYKNKEEEEELIAR